MFIATIQKLDKSRQKSDSFSKQNLLLLFINNTQGVIDFLKSNYQTAHWQVVVHYQIDQAGDVILIPYLLSTVIVSYIVYAFLNPTNGFMNNTILPMLGMDSPIKWYNEPKYWPVILTIVYLWMNFGYSSILYYSNIISIDKSLYEAAVMDCAGPSMRHYC